MCACTSWRRSWNDGNTNASAFRGTPFRCRGLIRYRSFIAEAIRLRIDAILQCAALQADEILFDLREPNFLCGREPMCLGRDSSELAHGEGLEKEFLVGGRVRQYAYICKTCRDAACYLMALALAKLNVDLECACLVTAVLEAYQRQPPCWQQYEWSPLCPLQRGSVLHASKRPG